MKSIYDWIITLPPEQKEKALSNMHKFQYIKHHTLVGSLKSALLRAFIWGEGQGSVQYWSDIYHGRNTELF